jgi:hypothetical protein
MYIGAITHADAVVKCQESLSPEVMDHLQNDKTKPVLEHRGDNIAEEYTEFYDTILSQN